MRLLVFALLSSLTFGTSLPAQGAAPDQAPEVESLIKKGNALRRAGREEDAWPLYRQAYERQRTGRTAAQLGLCEQALGRWADADDHLTEALASEDPWVVKNKDVLDRSVEIVKQHVARVEVTTQPAGALVFVNGHEVGTTPLPKPLRVSVGSIDLEARASGRRPAVQSLTIAAGEYRQVVLRLEEKPEAAGSTQPEIATAVQTEPPEAVGRTSWRPIATWTTAGVAAIAVGFGIVEQVRASSKYEDFNTRKIAGTSMPQCSTFFDDKGGADCSELLAAGDDAQTLALVGFVTGGVLAGVAAALWWTTPGHAAEEKISTVVCLPGLGSVNCGGRF